MPTLAELDTITRHPAPEYPEYETVHQRSRQEFSQFIDPAEIPAAREVARRRGDDWCVAVLGHPVPDPTRVSVPEARMLRIADEMNLDPPLPRRIRAWREEDRARQAEREQQRKAQAARDRQLWQDILDRCQVAVEVRPNTRGRRYGRGHHEGPVRHVVALRPGHSGRRRHLIGRALCETPQRSKPLELGDPVGQPATCNRCLNFADQITPETDA